MRGKTKVITFTAPLYERDDLGRRTRVPGDGVEVLGAASTPRFTRQTTPTGVKIDLVVHIPADADVPDLDAHVEVEGYGEFSILGMSGGRRIRRIDLARLQRRDSSSGRV